MFVLSVSSCIKGKWDVRWLEMLGFHSITSKQKRIKMQLIPRDGIRGDRALMDHLGPMSFAVDTNVIQVDLNTKCQLRVSAFDNTCVHVYNVWKSYIIPKQPHLGEKMGKWGFFPFLWVSFKA